MLSFFCYVFLRSVWLSLYSRLTTEIAIILFSFIFHQSLSLFLFFPLFFISSLFKGLSQSKWQSFSSHSSIIDWLFLLSHSSFSSFFLSSLSLGLLQIADICTITTLPHSAMRICLHPSLAVSDSSSLTTENAAKLTAVFGSTKLLLIAVNAAVARQVSRKRERKKRRKKRKAEVLPE